MDEEKWKDIPGYEGIYQASTFGRIRTAEGKVTYTEKHGVRHWKSRILKTRGKQESGYRASLWKDGKPKDWLTARLIATTFLGIPDLEMTVNHKDGNRFNNNIENLEWLSLADNIRHGFDTGLYSKQEHKIKLISTSKKEYKFKSKAEACRFLGRTHSYINDCLKRNTKVKDDKGNVYRIA